MAPSIHRRSRKRRNGGGRRRRTTPEKDEHGGGRALRMTTAVSLEQSTVMDIVAPYFPEEIFTNILKGLPVKSLIRFQCVCKDWKNLLKTPSFIVEHQRHSTQQKSVLLFKSGGCLCLINQDMQVFEYQTPQTSVLCPRFDIIGSSNGVLCLVYKSSFILWNPATREVLQLPDVPKLDRNETCYVGFGFSPIVNDYKIVRIAHGFRVYLVQVFSVSTWSWKEVGELKDILPGITPYGIAGFTLDGAIFLFGNRFRGGGVGSCLISFDITTESLASIPIPRSAHLAIESRLTTYENKLAMLSKNGVVCKSEIESIESFSINLWVMGKGGIWTKIYTIPDRTHFLRPLTIWRNEIVGVTATEAKIGLYCNLQTYQTNEFKMLARGKYSIGNLIWNYAESLVSVRDK